MSLYGRPRKKLDDYGLHELSEASLELGAADLRRVAEFFLDCADQLDRGTFRTSHRHLSGFGPSWSHDHPDFDLIVLNPASEPPKRVV